MNKIVSGQPIRMKSGTFSFESCCSCGLVHLVFYRIRRINGKQVIERVSYRDDWETNIVREKNNARKK